MRAGHGNIGKVEVDCRFLFTKSHWGVIGESKNPAGIVYLDLDFSQPPDCKLESATITVTLTEDDGEEARIQHRSACPVKFTDHYGPKCVRGKESLVQTKDIQNFTPEAQFMGYGAGGLGKNKEKMVQTTGRWDFSGYIASTKGSIWYNRLRWELKENTLEWQPTHNNLFHTAFALEHNATRFYMTVHVRGKLAKLSDKIKSRLKFGEKGGKDQEIVTKVEWAEEYSCPLRLDRIAQDLHEAMGYANMNKVPVEIPGALAASYHPAITNPVPSAVPVQPPLGNPQFAQLQPGPCLRPWLESQPPASIGGETSTMGNPMQHLPAFSLEELSMAGAGYAYRPPQPPQPPRLSTARPAATETGGISASSSVTLVNSAVPTQAEGDSTGEPVSDTCQKGWGGETEEAKPKNERSGVWLGVTAILLHWFGQVGVLLLGLAAAVGPPSIPKPGAPKSKNRNKAKLKTVEFDGASESSRTKGSAMRPVYGYPAGGRLRGRRQRPYPMVDVGKRKRHEWEDI
ncbi:hypothetical protein C8A01DRAFT_16291 [Parachaetomium inaequale]|uniref:Uncharacterized protein n=1 Tax=Parachaetomium inaequale TaxID=2588326 RepID=A0AAN6SRT8_9PEZI|nr:hypothetical protein C8A01DRAFT_16291 [Parachaetomium inaequale]